MNTSCPLARRSLFLLLVLGLLTVQPVARAQTACDPSDKTLVRDASGAPVFCGQQASFNGATINSYLGIPYAQQPVGNLRWQATTMLPLTTTQPATSQTSYGSPCLQGGAGKSTGSESCLFLNVWTPAAQIQPGAPKLPVMVFIHGGAFLIGSGGSQTNVGLLGTNNNQSTYDGSSFASQGVVLVTLNYRLGALGFYGDGEDIPYSLGIRDQQNAINWVKANIGLFGGDSSQITLFGESAGAMSVGLHTFSIPSNVSDGKLPWRAAIMESNPFGAVYPSPSNMRRANKTNQAFILSICKQTLGGGSCTPQQLDKASQLTFLQSSAVTTDVLLTAQQSGSIAAGSFIALQPVPINLPWTPIQDNQFINSQPLDGFPTKEQAIPLAFGVNQDEGAAFAGMGLFQEKQLLPTIYRGLLIQTFGVDNTTQILKTDRYNPQAQPPAPTYATPASMALGNFIGDYALWCGSLDAMDNALAGGSKIYGYLFAQAPFTDIYNLKNGTLAGKGPDNGACEPKANPSNVCHANELPYVFNSLGSATLLANQYEPTQEDTNLASAMNTAWATFAKQPESPGADWAPYTISTKPGGALVGSWSNGKRGPPVTLNPALGPNDSTPLCSGFWSQFAPYKSKLKGGKNSVKAAPARKH